MNLLLTDCEGPRENCPDRDNHRFYMIKIMESWFLADDRALQTWFGNGFKANRLRSTRNVELVPKRDVTKRLYQASSACGKKKYSGDKAGNASGILKLLDVDKVRNSSPEFDRLLKRLERCGGPRRGA